MCIKLTFSVIACVGGDGTFYEVLNGLANRADAKKALRIPLAPIPTGKLTSASFMLTSQAQLAPSLSTYSDQQRRSTSH
jgi:diacylglycerol kinase family enzyme